ncbi:hypothetical protein GCM10009557_09470 [Virgisporangium ochraceum]
MRDTLETHRCSTSAVLIVDVDARHDCYDRDADIWHQLWHDSDAVLRYTAEARRRCADGDPSAALVLGRDLARASGGDQERERLAHRPPAFGFVCIQESVVPVPA